MGYLLVPTKLFLKKLGKLDHSITLELEKKLEAIRLNPLSSEHRMHHIHNYFRAYVRNFRVIYEVNGGRIILLDIIRRNEGYGQYARGS